MTEYELRQEAIRRYLTGEKISKIAQSLNCEQLAVLYKYKFVLMLQVFEQEDARN